MSLTRAFLNAAVSILDMSIGLIHVIKVHIIDRCGAMLCSIAKSYL